MNKVALVTGSTSGIGLAIAQRLASDGFTLAFHSRFSTAAGEALARQYSGATYTQADLLHTDQVDGLADQVLSAHGRLDVLVNNAGMNAVIAHDNLSAAEPKIWRDLYQVNVIAPFSLITRCQSALEQAAGCVVNISSHAGVRPKGASIPYAASKAALNHVTQLLALSLAPNIRVNGIAPGLVDTPLTRDWQAAQALWRSRAPMQRGALPQEIADIAAMLVSNPYLTGETLLVDGGLNLT